MVKNSEIFIAKRTLLYAELGQRQQHKFEIRITQPGPVEPGSSSVPLDEDAMACWVKFDNFPEKDMVFYGADQLQALQFAVDIEPYLRAMSKKYDLFYDTGEPYFD